MYLLSSATRHVYVHLLRMQVGGLVMSSLVICVTRPGRGGEGHHQQSMRSTPLASVWGCDSLISPPILSLSSSDIWERGIWCGAEHVAGRRRGCGVCGSSGV